jgi:hypothetical protein
VASNLWSLGAYAVPGWSMRGGWRLNRSTGPERSRKIALGYSDDLLLKQTAVMDLNMRAASAGMMILRHLLQPFLLEPLPVTLSEKLVTYNMKSLETARSKDENCDICRSNPCAVMAIAVKPYSFCPVTELPDNLWVKAQRPQYNMEARGVEPLSLRPSNRTSTCLSDR